MIAGWKIPPTKFGEVTKAEHRELIAMIGLDITTRLVLATPVDTGRARANWWPSVGTARVRALKSTDQMRPIKLAKERFDPKRMPYFATLFIANNLPYIEALNNGHSKQAPVNFVESTVSGVVDVL